MCCQVEVSATGWSLVQRSPTDCGVSLCVISKNLKNEEAIARDWAVSAIEQKKPVNETGFRVILEYKFKILARAKEFQFTLPLKSFTTARCTEADSVWRIKGLHNVPKPALSIRLTVNYKCLWRHISFFLGYLLPLRNMLISLVNTKWSTPSFNQARFNATERLWVWTALFYVKLILSRSNQKGQRRLKGIWRDRRIYIRQYCRIISVSYVSLMYHSVRKGEK